MEHLHFSKRDTGFHIEGFPDAVKVIKLDDKLAWQLASYSLHHYDLKNSLAILESINGIDENDHLVRESLWHQAIVTYIKCFRSSKARIQLDQRTIYRQEPAEALEVFEYFLAIRNKNIHDENSVIQCLPGAVLNKKGQQPKIAKIACMTFAGSVLGQSNYSNLHLLITKALQWVERKFNSLCDQITQQLEREEYDDLLNRNSLTYSKPTLADLDKIRLAP